MMISENALINNIKSAFIAGSLTMEAKEEIKEGADKVVIWVIGGSKWEYTTEESNVSRKVKAKLLEATGILPEVGMKYTCGKIGGNQVTLRDTTRTTWEPLINPDGGFEITGLVYTKEKLGSLRFLKVFEKNEKQSFTEKIVSIYERIAHMIIPIDYEDEEKPVYTDYNAGHIVVTNGEEQIVIYETDCISDNTVMQLMKAVNEVL